MVNKEKVLEIASNYLKSRNRQYVDIDEVEEIILSKDKEILYGLRKGEICDAYIVRYIVEWALDYQSQFIHIDAHTGEVLYTISPTAWVEEWED